MATSLKGTFALVATACSLMLATSVFAQEFQGRQSAESDTERGVIGQSDRTQSEQADRQTTFGQQQRTAALGQRDAQSQAGSQDQKIKKYLTACLEAKNKAEVEIGQFAQQHAQHPEVKQYAQSMVQDHQQLLQQIQQASNSQQQSANGQQRSSSQQLSADRQSSATASTQLGASQASGSDSAIQQLIEMDKKITQKCTEALREELQQKQGAEFDKAFLGSQIAAHVQALAALEVMEQDAPQQIQQIAQQAQPVLQQHLQHAKQLMKQLDSDSQSTASQAERPSTRTQRQ